MPTLCLNSLTFCPCSHIFIIALKTGLWISLGRDRVSYSLLLPWPLGGTQYLVNVGWFDCKWKAASRQESMVVLIKAIHVSTFWASFVEWAMRGYMKLMVQCGSIRKTFLCLILYSPLLYFNPSFCLTVGLEAKVRCSMWRQEVWMISCEWQRIWRNDGGENEQHASPGMWEHRESKVCLPKAAEGTSVPQDHYPKSVFFSVWIPNTVHSGGASNECV